MLFSSPIFLFLFLPLALLGYYLFPRIIKNYWLLLASLIFFAWGGVSQTVILIASIIFNYAIGIAIERCRGNARSYRWLLIGVSGNLLTLCIFKYANFLTRNLNTLFDVLSVSQVSETDILLPVGISFYTFHLLSYLVDIYHGKTPAQRNILDLSLYVSMFSQLIAGPIIRYSDVWLQLQERHHTLAKFASGVERFIIGLGKKVLIANTFARVADTMFAADPGTLGAANAWLGIVSYTLQIYCDFAGYSDMAIGLGRMFGFEFKENFNFPYLATSVKDFWRRWHISLSSFFRDYVYIPLGGNRAGTSRMYLNLIIVFFLTGFWHGASWSFIVWGLFHGFFMILERLGFEKVLDKLWRPVATLYTLLVVMFAWVLFRAETLGYGLSYWKAMFDFNSTPQRTEYFMKLFNLEVVWALIIAVLGASGFFKALYEQVQKIIRKQGAFARGLEYSFHIASICMYAAIILFSSMFLVAGTYNPFIYYKF